MIGQIRKHPSHIGEARTKMERRLTFLRGQLENLKPDLSQCAERINIGDQITKVKEELLEAGLYVKADEGNRGTKFDDIA